MESIIPATNPSNALTFPKGVNSLSGTPCTRSAILRAVFPAPRKVSPANSTSLGPNKISETGVGSPVRSGTCIIFLGSSSNSSGINW